MNSIATMIWTRQFFPTDQRAEAAPAQQFGTIGGPMLRTKRSL
jgi:hypothetical protein